MDWAFSFVIVGDYWQLDLPLLLFYKIDAAQLDSSIDCSVSPHMHANEPLVETSI